MNRQFIEATIQIATYQRKEGTSSSYYWQSGTKILPNRLGISKDQFSSILKKGRNLQKITGQIKSTFKKTEISPLKQYKPYAVHTQIWGIPEYPLLIGYGSLGISNKDGIIDRTSDTEDLILINSPSSDWKEIKIYYFPKGMKSLYDIAPIVSSMIL
ncbi:MAG: hypothetical protein M0R37_02825 [Bacteroidales bacterium]|nr:hypothetical protein [Bacteroidales bacterium]